MDFLSNLTKGGGDSKKNKPAAAEENSAATAGLMTSAREAGAAAQSQVTSAPGKVAGAAADLLAAGSDYAKLDETKGFGKCVDQTEVYLRDYSTSQATPAAATAAGTEKPSGGGAGEYVKKAQELFKKPSESDEAKTPAAAETEIPSGGGAVKKAQEFFNKKSEAAGDEKKESEGLIKTDDGYVSK